MSNSPETNQPLVHPYFHMLGWKIAEDTAIAGITWGINGAILSALTESTGNLVTDTIKVLATGAIILENTGTNHNLGESKFKTRVDNFFVCALRNIVVMHAVNILQSHLESSAGLSTGETVGLTIAAISLLVTAGRILAHKQQAEEFVKSQDKSSVPVPTPISAPTLEDEMRAESKKREALRRATSSTRSTPTSSPTSSSPIALKPEEAERNRFNDLKDD
jgi:hypothetical protein